MAKHGLEIIRFLKWRKKVKGKTTLIRLYEIIYVGLLMLWSKRNKPPLKNTIHEFISRKEYEEDLSSGKLFDKLIREIKESPCDDKSGYYLKDSTEILDHNNIKEIFSYKKILLKELNTNSPVDRYTVIYEYAKKYYLWSLNKMEMESEDITKQQNFETSENPPLEIWNINLKLEKKNNKPIIYGAIALAIIIVLVLMV